MEQVSPTTRDGSTQNMEDFRLCCLSSGNASDASMTVGVGLLACLAKFCADTAILTRLGVVMIDPSTILGYIERLRLY